ncbi:UNVERIFIED_CONTAM: hypothetical protein GTU68_067022 [Idotea baltica]|nr:hypothetical protein [Idotea baltica]
MLPNSLNHLENKQIILGSGSPRRSELLDGLGLKFEIRISDVEETVPSDVSTEDYPTYLSELKAKALQSTLQENEILITADTIVTIKKEILNKPKTKSEAIDMISTLSGAQHKVITGITVTTTNGYISDSDTAQVSIIPMNKDEIEYYVNTFSPLDKAGAYGIQEWIGLSMINQIIGSYYTIMGLPTHVVYDILKNKIHNIL